MQEEKIKRSNRERKTEDKSHSVFRWLMAAGIEVLWGSGAWLLGQARMLFGSYPLGLALLCASPRHTVSILIGLVITTMSNLRDPIVYVCTYFAAALIRVFAGMLLDPPNAGFELPEALRKKLAEHRSESSGDEEKKQLFFRFRRREGAEEEQTGFLAQIGNLFNESICLRMATAAVASLIISLYYVISGGFLYYDFFAAVFSVVLVPVTVLIFAVSFEEKQEIVWLKHLSDGALLFCAVFAAQTVTMLSFPLAPMLALYLTLTACHTRGAILGIGTSVIVGVAYSPIYAPAYLLAALTYLFLQNQKKEGSGVFLSCIAMLTWSVYVGGAEKLLSLFPAALIAGAAFTVTVRILLKPPAENEEATVEAEPVARRMERKRHQDANERFRGISEAFTSLSEMFYNLSDRFRRPGTLDLRRLCDDSFDAFCADCPNKGICWGLEYSETLSNVNELIAALHTRGRVTGEELGEHLLHRCSRVEGILERINRDCARLTGEMLRNNRTEIFAMDYESAAKIINDALEEDDGEYRFDPELERRISEYLGDAGVLASGVSVHGNRRRRILIRGVEIEHAKVTFETMRSDLGEMCNSELDKPIFEVENNLSTMILQAKRKIAVTGAQNNVSADGGVSGDSVNLFSNKKDYFYALISDGMGAGKEAAFTSTLCSVFMEKMLRAGNRAGTSLRMLNHMIASRGADSTRECSSTIDLLELDLMTGEGNFIKSGAAPSFVIRGGVVRRIQAGTVPIGILCTLDAEECRFDLREGDTVVMISDGILLADPECEWITSYLASAEGLTPEEIVYQICLRAAEREEHDDCSAIALRITRAEE